MNPFDLTGSIAVVTGARRGLGFTMATTLARAGADIIGVSATIEDHGSAIEQAVTALGRQFRAFRADFADPASVEDLGRQLSPLKPDILINNAGIIRRVPAVEHPAAYWDEVIQVNLTSQFSLTQALAPGLIERGHGKIIFTASLLSFQGGINVPGYTASKSGIAGLTRALANEWAPCGINVNAIAPGYIATDNTRALREDPDRSRTILDRIPAGRWGTPDDLAGATLFLASPASDYVSGIVLPVDGGWLGR